MSEIQTNNNQLLIEGLRKAADFLESRPEFPNMGRQTLHLRVWGDHAQLKEAARLLGSFTKKFTDCYFELHRPINEAVAVEVYIDRESLGCKKIVTWDCPDESILKLAEIEEQSV